MHKKYVLEHWDKSSIVTPQTTLIMAGGSAVLWGFDILETIETSR